MSGLRVNLEKSTIYSTGIQEDILNNIRTNYKINSGSLPVRYLGLPLLTKRMTKEDYKTLVEKIRKKVTNWTGRLLSYAGRYQLLNSVITSIINFWSSAFILPKRCIREINSICSSFLWSGPDLKQNKAKINWTTVCTPKDEGGLGMRNLCDTNKVSSLKLIWRLVSSNSLWATWIRTFLCRGECFWSPNYRTSKGSWTWKKLVKLREEAKNFHKIKVGNGNSTSFWYDLWSELGRYSDLSPYQAHIAFGIPLQSSIMVASLSYRSRNFRTDCLSVMKADAENMFRALDHTKMDTALWKYSEGKFKSSFSSTQTWNLIRLKEPEKHWSKGIWFKDSTPKYTFITWLAFHDRLSTGDRISGWAPRSQISCTFCGCILESRNHLFFICKYSKDVWKTTLGRLVSNTFPETWDMVCNILTMNSIPLVTRFLIRYSFQATLYHVWRERNTRHHGGKPSPPALLIRLIHENVTDRIKSLQSQDNDISRRGLEEWVNTH